MAYYYTHPDKPGIVARATESGYRQRLESAGWQRERRADLERGNRIVRGAMEVLSQSPDGAYRYTRGEDGWLTFVPFRHTPPEAPA